MWSALCPTETKDSVWPWGRHLGHHRAGPRRVPGPLSGPPVLGPVPFCLSHQESCQASARGTLPLSAPGPPGGLPRGEGSGQRAVSTAVASDQQEAQGPHAPFPGISMTRTLVITLVNTLVLPTCVPLRPDTTSFCPGTERGDTVMVPGPRRQFPNRPDSLLPSLTCSFTFYLFSSRGSVWEHAGPCKGKVLAFVKFSGQGQQAR